LAKRITRALLGGLVGGTVAFLMVTGIPRISRLPSTSAGYHWRTVEIPHDKRWRLVDSIAVSPKGSVFVGRESSGVFRSDDGGRHWRRSISGMKKCSVSTVVVDSRGTVFAGTGRGIYRSVDNGKSWALANKGLPACSILSLTTNSRGCIYAGAQDGAVYESRDDARHWKCIRRGMGGSWAEVNSIAVTHKGSIFFSTENHGLWKSADGGAHWTDMTPVWSTGTLRGPNESMDAIAIDSQDRVYVAVYLSDYVGEGKSKTESFIMRSDDQGAHWVRGSKNLRCSAVAVVPSGMVIAGTERGLYFSSDHGNHWTAVRADFGSRIVPWRLNNYISCIAVDARRRVFAASEFGYVISGIPTEHGDRPTK
jgi:photosystem II stability/assembly factor-like uncharacterized protein